MAVKNYSTKITIQLSLVILLGWLALVLWALSLWIMHDYPSAINTLKHLLESQRQAVTPVAEGSLIAKLPTRYQFEFAIANPLPTQLKISAFSADLIEKAQQFIQLLLLASQCMLIKLMILVAALPLFSLAMIAGFIDGLNQRAIRTACLGRESSYAFHRLNHYFKKGLVLLLLAWLAMPISITPALVFIPVSLLLAVMIAMTASRFKKYL